MKLSWVTIDEAANWRRLDELLRDPEGKRFLAEDEVERLIAEPAEVRIASLATALRIALIENEDFEYDAGDLYDDGLVKQSQDITGEYQAWITDQGKAYIHAALERAQGGR